MNVSTRQGCSLHLRQIRATVAKEIFNSAANSRADQRVTPMEGLKAMTINGALQYGEQGSIEAGKLADLVILDKNPLAVDYMAIKDIKVVETIKEGKTIYKRAQ